MIRFGLISIMSIVVDESLTVWEFLSNNTNISEQQARRICADFTNAGVPFPADESVVNYLDDVQGMCECMEQSDIREALLQIDDHDEKDLFFYNTKINPEQMYLYLIHHNVDVHFNCAICREQNITSGGVKLSCSQRSKPCKAIFCKECVEPWLTQCMARCPSCRSHCRLVRNIPVRVKSRSNVPPQSETESCRKRIVITVKKKKEE